MLYTRDEETIIAQCTPRGSGAIALLRFSGVDAVDIVQRLCKLPQGKKLSEQQTHTIHYGWVVDAHGAHLDQVLFLLMRGPATFTGQDTVEITCHNNQFLVETIIKEAIKHGARAAQEGEFSRRAYLNGKIDLTQAEAIDELIRANTQFALKKSLAQVEGSFSHWVQALEKKLIKAAAWCEASFEFLDDAGDFVVEIRQQLETLLSEIEHLKKSFDAQKHIRQGIRIACIGSVNVGKSSLFNALLGQDRAIVADVAGTTRDSIEAGVYRNGVYWTFIDTAGLRQTADVIEAAGIERSHAEAELADIIILAFDSSRALTEQEQEVYDAIIAAHKKKIVYVATKADLCASYFDSAQYERDEHAINQILAPDPDFSSPIISSRIEQNFAHPERSRRVKRANVLPVSAITGSGIAELEQALDTKVAQLLQAHEAPFLVNKRQFQLLQQLEKNIQHILTLCRGDVQYELVAHHLRDTLENLSELTGKSVSEAALDAVFKEFCVGK